MRFEALREKLLKAGIAPRHVRRYLRELDDHLADLTAAEREAGYDTADAAARARARLGEDGELAAAMLARPEFKSWAARWPWLIFGVAPPLMMIALFFVAVLPLGLVAHFHGVWMHNHMPAPLWFRIWARSTAFLANFGLGPVLAALLVCAAQRQRMGWKWPSLAIVIIALAGFHMVTRLPQIPEHSGQVAITALQLFRLVGHYSEPPWVTLAQFLLTLAPSLWLFKDRFVRRAEPG